MTKDLLLTGYVAMKFCLLNFVFTLFFEWYDILAVGFFIFIHLCKLSPVSRHEDGTVRFWDASSTSMSLLYKLSTASLFNVEIHGDHNSGEVEEEWPPFRKVHRGMVMVPWRIRTTAPCMAHTITFTVSNFNWVFIIFHILL